jgi:hypothetical protein
VTAAPIFIPKYTRIPDLAKLFKTSPSKITAGLKLLKNKKKLYMKYDGLWFEFHSPGEVIIPSSVVQELAVSLQKDIVCLEDSHLLSFDDNSLTTTTTDMTQQQAIPVVALLGHFNHGKTTLLDALRGGPSIVNEEAHQITQVCE